jgi:superfamily II DNA/RNA helicase
MSADVVNLIHVSTEDYIHRIGRTDACSSGEALSLVCPEEAWMLVEIEKLLKRQIPRVADTGYEPVSLKVVDAPKKNAPHKTTGKKDFRHTKKPATRGAKPAQGERKKKVKRQKKSLFCIFIPAPVSRVYQQQPKSALLQPANGLLIGYEGYLVFLHP